MADERRFERLYAEHYDAVARYLLARTGRDSAGDAISRTFEIAWRRLTDVPATPLPWLLGVARRVLAEQRRASGRHDALIERIAQTVSETSEDHADALAARELVLSGIRDLSPMQREALLLTAWDGLSQREVAEALGCSRGALAVRLHRARRQLRASLAVSRGDTRQGGDLGAGEATTKSIRPSAKEAL